MEKTLSQWPAWCEQKPQMVRRLRGGLTNDSYLLQTQNRQYVLRINASNSRALDLDRSNESDALHCAARAGIGAQVVYSDPQHQYLVTEYIVGRQWQVTDLTRGEGVERVAALLNSIHRLEPVAGLLNIGQKAANYWLNIDTQSALARALAALRPQVEWHITRAEEARSGLFLCHNDLLPENLILGDNACLYAIDWEYAAMGDPYFDLAVIIEGHGLDDDLAQQLLSAYIGATATAHYTDRLMHNRVIYCYLALLWYGVKSSDQPNAGFEAMFDSTLAYLQRLLARCGQQ